MRLGDGSKTSQVHVLHRRSPVSMVGSHGRETGVTPVAARDLFLGAIALIGATLIARPWLRATALAAIAGFMGMVVTSSMYESHGPGQWLKQIALGWFFGVVAGSLLAVVVFRIREKEWPSGEDAVVFPGSAFLLVLLPMAPALVVVLLFGRPEFD